MKDNRKKSKFISMMGVILLMAMIMATGVSAASVTQTISLGSNYAETPKSATRTGDFSYVDVKCTAVYPDQPGYVDNYTKIRVRIRFIDRTPMSDQEIITEGTGVNRVHLYEGHLSKTSIQFIFTGNSTASARADVTYDPK